MRLVIKERSNKTIIAAGSEGEKVQVFDGNWYFSPELVDMENLRITERTYTCPYKGVCYWIDLKSGDETKAQNVGWVYRNPKPGYEFIKDQIAFYSRPTTGTVAEKSEEAIA
ncbi:MAG: DUF427 domain-containing protein [Anaerolineae bacterium]